MSSLIQVFEHQTLKVYENPYYEDGSRKGITESEFKKLLKYHSTVSDQYFTPSLNKIKFNHYVGVIQVGSIVIEVLPKAGKLNDKEMWSSALYKMIRIAKNFRSKRGSDASLQLRNEKILDLYFMEYLNELEEVMRVGLRKKYRFTSSNIRSVKGKILFTKDCVVNHSDKSQTYCRFQVFDFEHEINKVMLHALNLVKNLSTSREICQKAKLLSIEFPESLGDKINFNKLDSLETDRNTDYCRKTLKLAKMIIKNHSPSLKSESNNVISFLFDMNHLFEEFVFKSLRKRLSGYEIYRKRITYWNGKRLIPDILVKNKSTGDVFVMDTKWKLPKNFKPEDADLRQVFTYNEYFNARKGALLYPYTPDFVQSNGQFKDRDHECSILSLRFFDNAGRLDPEEMCNSISEFLKIS